MPSPATHQASVIDQRRAAGDRLGMWASLVCALHCALVPLLLATVPTAGISFFSSVDFDQIFVIFATLLGVSTLALGYRRHRAFAVWALLVAGLLLVWSSTFTSLHDHSFWHAVMMVSGGVLIAAAHLFNSQLTSATQACYTQKP